VEFRILGPLEVSDDGRRLTVAGAKPRTLLGVLLLHGGEAVSVDRLVDELWGEAPPETATAALQVHVSNLRKALGRDTVVRVPAGYALPLDGHELDLRRFERLVAEARTAAPEQASDLLGSALDLWRGEPEVGARRLGELRRAALEARIDADLELGRADEVIPELQELVEAEPLQERLRARLVLALYRSGRQAEALDEVARAREVLVDELGVEPGPELRQLQRAILEQDPELAQPSSARVSSVGRSLLPASPAPLLGRRDELDELATVLRGGDRLVTLTGPGGIGKTRLALEAVGSFDDRAVFVPLDAIEDASLVSAAVANALGLDVAGGSPEQAVAASLRSTPATLLLDNFEQVLEAATFVATCLAASPDVRVVVTSRFLLRLAGEREFAVPPLDAAVELFVARSAGPVGDLDAVRQICERLDGIPLAIELAAARTSLLSPRALLERLDSRLALLTGGTRDAPARQRTMRDTIDWSYRLLDPPEQRLLARLAVFHGGATLTAIEEVCGEGIEVLDVLASLVEKSLVRRREAGEEPRFAMLETVREYAADQLVGLGENEELAARQLAWCVRLGTTASDELEGPRAPEWLDILERELPNLRAALDHAIERGDGASAAALAGSTRRFWQVHGHLVEGRRWLERVVALEGAPPDAAARAWTGLGILLGEQGAFDEARGAFEHALALARAYGDPLRISSALNNLGSVALYQGDFGQAEERYAQALALAQGEGSEHYIAVSQENLGCIRLLRGDVTGAIEAFRASLELTRALGELRSIAAEEPWLAAALVEIGELDEARSLFAHSLPIAQQIGYRQGVGTAIVLMARYALALGRLEVGARLAAAGSVPWAVMGATMPTDVSLLGERVQQQLRVELGDAAFEQATADGRLLDEAGAVELALETLALEPVPASRS
jgi:predicted ATPase/DNA-binding SARP family transcriptional activator